MVAAATASLFVGSSAHAQTPAPAQWVKIPLLSPDAQKMGVFPGGEGGQVVRDLQVSQSDPTFLMLGIDVGGLFRTRDGGAHWETATVGWNARGANAFAIDPRNPDHVLGVGGNSSDWDKNWGRNFPNGLYLSTNRAASWRHLLPRWEGTGGAVAWEPASFDKKLGACQTAYFLPRDGGLWKTSDGGKTWAEINKEAKAAFMRPHPTRAGVLYLGGPNGAERSDDGGLHFTPVTKEPVFGLDVSPAAPESVWMSGKTGVLVSRDGGKTAFVPVGSAGQAGLDLKNKPVQNVRVSSLDTGLLACWIQGDNYQWIRYTSRDGGASWATVQFDNHLATLPYNVRDGLFAFHPTNKQVMWGLGGDWVTQSVDGGKTFGWKNNGNNGIMVGGSFNFNPRTPQTVFLAFQDYNGAFTNDGGATWNYRDVSGKGWGGFCYGGYAASPRVMWCGDAPSWGGKRSLRITRDGGKTWAFAMDEKKEPLVFSGPDVSLSDPADPNVCFASNLRSPDGGQTWAAMPACDGVYAASGDGTLWGKKENAVVRSTDKGQTWETVAQADGGISDLAWDSKNRLLYAASGEKLKRWDGKKWTVLSTPPDQYASTRIQTVAVDAQNPGVVYAGGARDVYLTHAAICRSADGGKTWRNLTASAPLGPQTTDGPHEVSVVRVHPQTHWAWVNGQCFGMWKIAPPRVGEKGDFVSVWTPLP